MLRRARRAASTLHRLDLAGGEAVAEQPGRRALAGEGAAASIKATPFASANDISRAQVAISRAFMRSPTTGSAAQASAGPLAHGRLAEREPAPATMNPAIAAPNKIRCALTTWPTANTSFDISGMRAAFGPISTENRGTISTKMKATASTPAQASSAG